MDLKTSEHPQIASGSAPRVLELGDGTTLVLKGERGAARPVLINETLDLSRALDLGGAPFVGYERTKAAKIS